MGLVESFDEAEFCEYPADLAEDFVAYSAV